MIRQVIILFLLPVLLLVGCTNGEREARLDQREQALLVKEQEFAKKETEYQSLLKFRDSLAAIRDSSVLRVWPDSIAGKWNAKLVCTESNCNNYVIGDQRSEQWEFTNDSTNLLVKVTNNNQLVRLYTGTFEKNKVHLNFRPDTLAERKTGISVAIDAISKGKMKGVRTNIGANECVALFSVDLNRILNPEL